MKRFAIYLLCAVLLCNLWITGNATEDTRTLTIIPSENWVSVYVYTWDPEYFGPYPGTYVETIDGKCTIRIPNSMENLLIAGMHTDGTYTKTDDLRLELNGKNTTVNVTSDNILYEGISHPIQIVPIEEGAYRVVGNAEWMGNWQPDNDVGIMLEVEPGVYTRNFANVPPGCYEFKITKDGKWDNAYGVDGLNYCFTVEQECTIKITFTLKDDVGIIDVRGTSIPFSGDDDDDSYGSDEQAVTTPIEPDVTTPAVTTPAEPDVTTPAVTTPAEPAADGDSTQVSPLVNYPLTWPFLPLFGILAVCVYLLFLMARRNQITGEATPDGRVYRRRYLSKQAVTRCIKESAPSPSDRLDRAVLDAIQKAEEPPENS